MATTILSKNQSYLEGIDDKLEIFSLIWLDENVKAQDSQDTEQKLRTVINHLKKFQYAQECQQYVEQRSHLDRLVIITSGLLGKEVVPSIHKLRQVAAIYICGNDREGNEQWACKFAKVKAVITELDELVSRIKADHKIRMKIEEPLSINTFTIMSTAGKSTTAINGHFVFTQLLIDCLLRIEPNETDKNELISCCMSEYEGNEFELGNLQKFQKDYAPSKAIWWYTRESFFYKTLNAALRKQNIHMMFLYRSFISDIHNELRKHRSKVALTVYRSQLMTHNELEDLKRNIGQLISVNSFLSTSSEYQTAFFFLGDTTTVIDLERVLFKIEANPGVPNSKPFADINMHSEFKEELEILFMLGSVFRLDSITHHDNQVWIIRMTLCSDDEHDLEQVLAYMKNQHARQERDLRMLGKLLWKMGKLDLAEEYYGRFLDGLTPNHPSLDTLYDDLAEITSQMGNYDKSILWHQKSLAMKKRGRSADNHPCALVGNIHHDARWTQSGVIVSGGYGSGDALNQLNWPNGLYVDDDQTVYVADTYNHRVVEWKWSATSGEVVAGANDRLIYPTRVIVDEETKSVIICDRQNRRVIRSSYRSNTKGQTIIKNIDCEGVMIDNHKFLYVCDWKQHEVRQYQVVEENGKVVVEAEGIVVAGGNGQGGRLNQLSYPTYVFVDLDQSVYVSDRDNHRVMKWIKGAREGIIVAGGRGRGGDFTQLFHPEGLFVDRLDTVYVADSQNHRVMRWCKEATQGNVVIGGNGKGQRSNQLNQPTGLAFDRDSNLYVTDRENHRVLRFSIMPS